MSCENCSQICVGACTVTCSQTCADHCFVGCSSKCSWSCADDCYGTCSALCADNCSDTCSILCADNCTGTCLGTCEGTSEVFTINIGSIVSGSIEVYGNAKWYEFFTVESPNYQGAYDINVTNSYNTTLELYKDNGYDDYTLVGSRTGNGTLSLDLYGCTNYVIKMHTINFYLSSSYTLSVKRHLDSSTSSSTIAWVPSSTTPIPTYNGMYYSITYLSISGTTALYNNFRHTAADTVRDAIEGLAVSAAIDLICYLLGTTSPHAMLFYSICKFCGEYASSSIADSVWNSSNMLQNGISVPHMNLEGCDVSYSNISPWTTSTIFGVEGYRGYFSTNESDFLS